MIAVVNSLRELETAGRYGQLANAPNVLAQAKHQFQQIHAYLDHHVMQSAVLPLKVEIPHDDYAKF